MSLVEVDRYFTTVEAEVYRMLLNSHGIDAVLFDTGFNNAEGGGMATATRLMVLAGDRNDAAAILADDRTSREADARPGQR